MRSKGQILLNLNHKDFYTKFCACSHKKDIKHIDRTIHSVACDIHKWCDLGMLGVKSLGMEICGYAQSTARSYYVQYSGLDTDVEQLYTIFIVNVNSLKFPLTLIHTNS